METAKKVVRSYREAQSLRSPYEADWRRAAKFCLPGQYAAWNTDGPAQQRPLADARRESFDSVGKRSLVKYAAMLERLATPAGQVWHALMPSDPELRKIHAVREYFDKLNTRLFEHRYHPSARFRVAMGEIYAALGAYGMAALYVGRRNVSPHSADTGVKYKACALRDMYVLADDDGTITSVYRRFWLNVRQFKSKFPGQPLPKSLEAEDKKEHSSESAYFEFVHYVYANPGDHDPKALDVRRHLFRAVYVAVKDEVFVGEEDGYQSMPYKVSRIHTVSESPYGYGPALLALEALGSASAIKRVSLIQGQKAVDPPLLAHDDGQVNGGISQRPGAINYGAIDHEGRRMVMPLQAGDFRVSEALLAAERSDVEDAFFVTLFQILTETPEMTATEVMERGAEKAALLSPTMGRLQSEVLQPLIERELEVLSDLGAMPEMPPELVEAEGEYTTQYTSPLARGLHAEEVSGFMRAVESAIGIANATQDMSVLDPFNFDVAIPQIADHMAVPASWLRAQKEIEEIRQNRAEQQARQQMMQNAPALASAASTAAKMGEGQ